MSISRIGVRRANGWCWWTMPFTTRPATDAIWSGTDAGSQAGLPHADDAFPVTHAALAASQKQSFVHVRGSTALIASVRRSERPALGHLCRCPATCRTADMSKSRHPAPARPAPQTTETGPFADWQVSGAQKSKAELRSGGSPSCLSRVADSGRFHELDRCPGRPQ